MRKEVQLLAVFSVLLLIFIPLSSANLSAEPVKKRAQSETTKLLCLVGKQKVVKVLPSDLVDSLMVLAASKRGAFLTIYNKYATDEEVEKAFEEVQPFFAALVENGLTDKSVGELTALFRNIRDMIKKPSSDPFGPRPCGSWNGLPTFFVGNALCGVFCADAPAIGFALGTHTILPTIGADGFITWGGNGETITVGALGFTTSTGPEFGVIFGFIGVLLATPIMILVGIFMTGFAALYFGIGPAPF